MDLVGVLIMKCRVNVSFVNSAGDKQGIQCLAKSITRQLAIQDFDKKGTSK